MITTYEAHADGTRVQFLTESERDAFIAQNPEIPWVKQIGVMHVSEPNEEPNAYLLLCDKALAVGKELITTFLRDNWLSETKFTQEFSLQLLADFSIPKQFAETGDIRNTRNLISAIAVNALFTQERKTKYLAMCDDFLSYMETIINA